MDEVEADGESAVPERPALAGHVAARRHRIAGRDQVALHDLLHEQVALVGPREWALLRSADGTRDLEGIALAAARHGHHARRDHLLSFFRALRGAGMLTDGSAQVGIEHGAAVAAGRSQAPLDPLPGYRLDCDGRGTCCRIYPTILFSPLEAAGARARCPEVLDGGHDEERMFTAERGAAEHGLPQARAVVLVDGRCAYLADDRRCHLHRQGGAGAKPLGCRLFPTTFTDDGQAIRASVAPECACVFASVGSDRGERLVPPTVRCGADLPAEVYVSRLGDPVVVGGGRQVARASYVAWSRGVAARFGELVQRRCEIPAGAFGADCIDVLWALADALERAGLESSQAEDALATPPPLPLAELRPWVAGLGRLVARRRPRDAAWRSDRDLARRCFRWLEVACELVERRLADGRAPVFEASARAAGAALRAEAFYLHALLHGHRVLDGLPVAAALRDRAVRIAVARALPEAMAGTGGMAADDPALTHPLALCEAMVRGHGLHGYAALAAVDGLGELNGS